jgi:hypothetical protein
LHQLLLVQNAIEVRDLAAEVLELLVDLLKLLQVLREVVFDHVTGRALPDPQDTASPRIAVLTRAHPRLGRNERK